MSNFKFGQPEGGVVQFCYTVADLQQGMRDFTQRLGVGPWFKVGPFTPPMGLYRGQKMTASISLALGFHGHIQYELIQMHDEEPSVYREKPLGFHHWGVGARDFGAKVEHYKAMGYEVAFFDQMPDGTRVSYMDPKGDLPGFIEVIEMGPALEGLFTMMFEAAADWDGSDPVRTMGGPGPG